MKHVLKAAAAVASLASLAFLAILVACNSQRGPAEAAIKAAEAAIGSVKAEAERWVPDQAKAAEDSLAKAKDQFVKGDFPGTITFANDAATKARDLGAAAIARKAELTAAWDDVSASLPKMIESVKARVDDLAKLRKLPKGIDKQAVAKGKEGLAALQSSWGEAQKAFGAGDLPGAIEKATAVKAQGAELTTLLGMPGSGAPAAAAAEPAPTKAKTKAKASKKK